MNKVVEDAGGATSMPVRPILACPRSVCIYVCVCVCVCVCARAHVCMSIFVCGGVCICILCMSLSICTYYDVY